MRRLEYEPLVGQLKVKLDFLGTDGLLFDADDTLFKTTEYMVKHKTAFADWAASYLNRPFEEVEKIFIQAANDAYDVLHVAPERWDLAVRMTSEKLTGSKTTLDGGIEIIRGLFFDSPEMIPGARLALEIFRATGRKMALVTHAAMYPAPNHPSWTEIKLAKNGLERYFDAVWIADEKRNKGEEDWAKGAEMLGLSFGKLMGFGDSVGADIIPMTNLGIMAMAIKPTWKRSNGDLPSGVLLLGSLIEAPGAILSL